LIQRDEETAEPKHFYSKFPLSISEMEVILVDPMLATGGSLITALNVVLCNILSPREYSLFRS
jgi:uracil phosphoribosyltransferase